MISWEICIFSSTSDSFCLVLLVSINQGRIKAPSKSNCIIQSKWPRLQPISAAIAASEARRTTAASVTSGWAAPRSQPVSAATAALEARRTTAASVTSGWEAPKYPQTSAATVVSDRRRTTAASAANTPDVHLCNIIHVSYRVVGQLGLGSARAGREERDHQSIRLEGICLQQICIFEYTIRNIDQVRFTSVNISIYTYKKPAVFLSIFHPKIADRLFLLIREGTRIYFNRIWFAIWENQNRVIVNL